MTEVVVGRVADFPDGTHKVVEAAGPLCEGRAATGTLAADRDSDWEPRWVMQGEVIACPWHGLEYHVPTGRCLAYPAITLRRYPVEVRGADVVVTVGGRRR